MLSTTDELRELSQVDTVDLKPPNVSFKNHKPLSISNVESFQSEDGHLLTPTNQYGGSSRNVTLKRSETRSLYAKHKLQRVVSRRFGDNNNKRIIKRALSQFLIDEEFDAQSMKTDLKDPDGYIIDHLSIKFNWDQNTRHEFYKEVSAALNEEDTRIERRRNSKSVSGSNFKSNTIRTDGGTHYMNYDDEEDVKYNDNDNNNDNNNDKNGIIDNNITINLKEEKYEDTDIREESTPLKRGWSKDTAMSNDDDKDDEDKDDDIGISQNVSDNWAESKSHLNTKRKTRYPEYVIKAIFYAADDEHVEVLLDQAINFIANDPRFNYLWHDEDFIQLLYSDKTYSQAVEKLMKEIKDIEFIDKADFFHQFVYREYDRERKDYIRDLLTAQEDKTFRNRAGATTSSTMHFETVYDYMNSPPPPSMNMSRSRTESWSIPPKTINQRYTLKYINSNNNDNKFDIKFKIRQYKETDETKYRQNKSEYFKLPKTAPNAKFIWAQYQRKKIKRYDKGNKPHGYWKLLKPENETEIIKDNKNGHNEGRNENNKDNNKTIINVQLTSLIQDKQQEIKKKTKQKKKPPIPISHLNQILGLMRFYIKQQKLEKERVWIFKECEDAFNFKDDKNDNKKLDKNDILVTIQSGDNNEIRNEYKISWWNGGDALDSCVALAIRKQIDPKKFYFYLCFRADIEDKISWQWYNNDESCFQNYELGFETFAQLEASFQANLHTNFPFNIMMTNNNNNSKKTVDESPFNLPCIPEMVKAMKKQKKTKSSAQHYIIRYLFTKSKRIQDMEQLSVNKSQPEYPRRIKRMIAGTNQNTLFAYFLKKSDFVDEWKERFLLSQETQIYFFWSFILSIATTMKYMQLELENQFITFSFRRNKNIEDNPTFHGLDTSDLRREIRDLDLFDGFIVPPYQIMQTQDVFNTEDTLKPSDWYRTLSTVGILEKRKYYDNFGGTLHDKPSNNRNKTDNGRYDTCPHDFDHDDYPWQGALGTRYCDRCANMMRFGEYLRKFCLEYENRELINFLWPWHKNTFHCKDKQKYHEAIARQNFNFLFDCEDLLNYVPKKNIKEKINNGLFQNDDNNEKSNFNQNRSRSLSKGGKISQKLQNEHNLATKDLKTVFEAHIRHKRKYTARYMLGAWESLKNLNIIKIQMGAVFEQLEIDRVHAEVAAAAKESINIKFHEIKENKNEQYEAKEWKMTKESWPKWLEKWNIGLKKKLENNHWLMILKLNKFKKLDIGNIAPKQLPNWDSFLEWALSPIYIDPNEQYFDDDDLSDSFNDNINDDDDIDYFSDDDKIENVIPRVKSEATLQKQMMSEWKSKFRESWTRVPAWWHIGHDKVLIELAITNMFQERKYYRSLTRRGAYYRMRLNQSLGEQDYAQDVAFQEFKNWCIRWENIMHRVRYISAVVARQLSSIEPSIIELLIQDSKDRPTWSCESLVFLNDNQKITHIQRIKDLPKPNDFHKTIQKKKTDHDDFSLLIERDNLNYDENGDEYEDDIDDIHHLLVMNKFQNVRSVRRLIPKFGKSKTQFMRDEIDAHRFTDRRSPNDDNNNNNNKKVDWARLFKECRTRDPFMIRDLGFELKEILNTFDLVTYGQAMSSFVIELLRTRNLPSLWTFLGVLLKTMPNKTSLKILYDNRTQLRRAKPNDLDWICRQVIQGTRFIIPACLFLSHFMKENARDDLARNGVWESYSKQYEEFAAEQVSSIEDDFMLLMLMNIPVYMKEISLIQLALEQHNTLFLNTERVNRIITHTWFTANPLNPHIEMLSHKKNPKRNLRDAFKVLTKKPIYFYLTPFGYQWVISLMFTFYVICIIIFVATNSSADQQQIADNGKFFISTMSYFEQFIWFMNLGFITAEFVQFYSLGRTYFSVDGAVNIWDIFMSLIWCTLAAIRFSFLFGYIDDTPPYTPPGSSLERRRRLNTHNDDYYCPPDFFSCNIRYNESCMAEISSDNNEIIDFNCDGGGTKSKKRQLQDSDTAGFDTNVDYFYEEETETKLKTSPININGDRCVEINDTIPINSSDYFWNSTCFNYYDDDNNNNTALFGNDNSTFDGVDDCIIIIQECKTTFDTQLLVTYNVLWAIQVSMLTIRLLQYFESAGGFFGILLRIVRSMTIEVLKFGVIIIIVTIGFLFAIYALFSVDINTEAANTFTDLYDVVIFFFKLLFGGGNVGTIDTFYQNYRVFAQVLIMVFAILGVRMFMSLLIALMSGAMNRVRAKAKSETSFTSALYAYELSTTQRVMPLPLNVVVFIIALIIHILNFLPAIIISPTHCNIYCYINQKRLFGCCYNNNNNNNNDDEIKKKKRKKKHIINSPNHMNTRWRVFYYYITSLIPCLKKYVKHDWRIHHIGCFNTIIGIYGNEEIQAVSTNEYYSILETNRKHSEENRKLNVYDKLFLKHLTLKTLFCKHCFRPINLEAIRSNLLTPFEALTNIISCYSFLILWPFFIPFFWILCQIEKLIQYWTEELRAHSPKLLLCRQREYDLEYFPRSAVKPLSVRQKTKKDFDRLGTGGPDVNDVDVNYDEMDDVGE